MKPICFLNGSEIPSGNFAGNGNRIFAAGFVQTESGVNGEWGLWECPALPRSGGGSASSKSRVWQ